MCERIDQPKLSAKDRGGRPFDPARPIRQYHLRLAAQSPSLEVVREEDSLMLFLLVLGELKSKRRGRKLQDPGVFGSLAR
jgi:hypothetical protein